MQMPRSFHTSLGPAVRGLAGLLLLAGCVAEATLPEAGALRYQITSGACGTVAFTRSVGSDSATALRAVEMAKRKWYAAGAAKLELSPLTVVDAHGEAPRARFYAVHVLGADGRTHLESVSQAITTEGGLYGLRWCDD